MLKKIIKINDVYILLQVICFIITLLSFRRLDFLVFLFFFGTFVFVVYNAIVQSLAERELSKNSSYVYLRKHFKFVSLPWDDLLVYRKAKENNDTVAVNIIKQRYIIIAICLLRIITSLVLLFVYHPENISI
ncbi:MAG: hypothetical protein IJL63_01750 [Clostridia bacterium]|nr:hypothetical protein [Clostridia bacterium]